MNRSESDNVQCEMEGDRRRELLRAARNGDMDAFAALFEGLRPKVHAVACRRVGETDAEDVVMETYLKAWRALPNFSERASLSTWLYRIAHNCALDALRARARRAAHMAAPGSDGEPVSPEAVPDPRQRGPDQEVASAEEAGVVRLALDDLPGTHRETLLLRFADGLSYSEIAAATGVSIGTVMSRIFHGRRKLWKRLRDLGVSAGTGPDAARKGEPT